MFPLPGSAAESTESHNNALNVQHLQILVQEALKQQLPDISCKICEEVFSKRNSALVSPNVHREFHRDGTKLSLNFPIEKAAQSKLSPTDRQCPSEKAMQNCWTVTSPKAKSLKKHDARKGDSAKAPSLTWIGTPRWHKRQPAVQVPTTCPQELGPDEQQAADSQNTSKHYPDIDAESQSSTAASSNLRETASFDLRRVERDGGLPDELFSRPLACIVFWEGFDYIAGVMVFLSTVFIGVKTDYLQRNPTWFVNEFEVIQLAFCAFFVIEIGMRLYVFRMLFFKVDGWGWNVLDLSLTVYQVLQQISEFFMRTYPDQLGIWWLLHRPTPLSMYIRFLRFLRLLGLIRIPRVQKYITEFRIMASSILHSVRYLIWACVILLVFIYICAVHISLIVGRIAVARPDDVAPESLLHNSWGTLPRSMFSLFQAVTGGDDWYKLLLPLLWQSRFAAILFCFYICFTYLYIMNIFTGVFVDSAISVAQVITDGNVVDELCEMFHLDDQNDDGQLTFEEFQRHLADPRMKRTLQALDLNVQETEKLFSLLDIDNSGSISYNEFMTGCLRLRGNAKSIDVATLLYECRRTKVWVHAVHERLLRLSDRLLFETNSRASVNILS